MPIKDFSMAYQRQRHTVAAKELSCVLADGNTASGVAGSAALGRLDYFITSGSGGGSNAAGTVITEASAFENVVVGDRIVFGSTGPDSRTITARTNNTVTVAALTSSLRNQNSQDWRVYRSLGVLGLEFFADDDALRHHIALPSNWDTQDDLDLYLHFVLLGGADNDENEWTASYVGTAPDGSLTGAYTALSAAGHTLDTATDAAGDLLTVKLGTVPASALHKGGMLAVNVALDTDMSLSSATTSNVATERLWVTGLSYEYTPKWTTGSGANARPYQQPQHNNRW